MGTVQPRGRARIIHGHPAATGPPVPSITRAWVSPTTGASTETNAYTGNPCDKEHCDRKPMTAVRNTLSATEIFCRDKEARRRRCRRASQRSADAVSAEKIGAAAGVAGILRECGLGDVLADAAWVRADCFQPCLLTRRPGAACSGRLAGREPDARGSRVLDREPPGSGRHQGNGTRVAWLPATHGRILVGAGRPPQGRLGHIRSRSSHARCRRLRFGSRNRPNALVL